MSTGEAFGKKVDQIFMDAAQRAIEEEPAYFVSMCQSPIEELFLYAVWANGTWMERVKIAAVTFNELLGMSLPAADHMMILCVPQCEVGRYRVDFVLAAARANGEPPCLIAVECDGHEFHERTKEQAAKDKRRDRELSDAGILVYRFTGSEIWKDAGHCARSVIEKLEHERNQSWGRHFARTPYKEPAE